MADRPLYIASCSFGKDSMATILLAWLHNEPLDRIFFVEVMFDNANGISGEIPEHIEWVRGFAIPYLRLLFGSKVQIDLVRSEMDYMRVFTRKCTRSKRHPERVGKPRGFLMQGKCLMNVEGKMKEIKRYYNQFPNDIVEYIGIAADEPQRMNSIDGEKRISLLQKYEYTELDAWNLCKQFGLLSPGYKFSTRNGCWFCPNMRREQQCVFRKHHPELWDKLVQLNNQHKDEIISKTFTINKTFERICKEMDFRDMQQKLDFQFEE